MIMRLIFCTLLIFSLSSILNAQYQKLDLNSVSEEKKAFALKFLQNVYVNKNIPVLKVKEATSYFRKKIKEVNVLKSAKKYDEIYGTINSITLAEVLLKNDYKILRYKVKRSETDRFFEFSIGLNEKHKFNFLENKRFWADKYYGFGESPKMIKQDTNSISKELKKQTYEFALRSYNKCNIDSLFKVNESNMVNRALRSNFNKNQLKECDSIKLKHGNLNNVKFEQVLSDSIYTKVYRYRANFENLKTPSEIRVYTNLKDKYKGIFIIDVWFEEYKDFKKATEASRNLLGN